MAIVKIKADEFDLSINHLVVLGGTGTTAVPDWVHISGVTSFTISTTKNDIDTRDFDSGGWLEHIVGSRGKSFTISGARMEDPDTGDQDPGQEACEALGDLFGADAVGQFQITSPSGKTYTFDASANVTPFGGGLDAFATFNVDLTMSGEWAVA